MIVAMIITIYSLDWELVCLSSRRQSTTHIHPGLGIFWTHFSIWKMGVPYLLGRLSQGSNEVRSIKVVWTMRNSRRVRNEQAATAGSLGHQLVFIHPKQHPGLDCLATLPSCWDSRLCSPTLKHLILLLGLSLLWSQPMRVLRRLKRWQRTFFQNLRRPHWHHWLHVWLDTKVLRITPKMDLRSKAYIRRRKMLPLTRLIIVALTAILSQYYRGYGPNGKHFPLSHTPCWEQSRQVDVHSSQQPMREVVALPSLKMVKLKASLLLAPS